MAKYKVGPKRAQIDVHDVKKESEWPAVLGMIVLIVLAIAIFS